MFNLDTILTLGMTLQQKIVLVNKYLYNNLYTWNDVLQVEQPVLPVSESPEPVLPDRGAEPQGRLRLTILLMIWFGGFFTCEQSWHAVRQRQLPAYGHTRCTDKCTGGTDTDAHAENKVDFREASHWNRKYSPDKS